MRRALEIDERSFGPDHPEVATDLNNLAELLKDMDLPAEAERLMRRSLAIDEQSFGPDHPKVAIRLNNLAQLLQDADRLAEAEPLMRRVLKVFLRFTVDTGHGHPHFRGAVRNYTALLERMSYNEDQVKAQLDNVGRPFGMRLGSDT